MKIGLISDTHVPTMGDEPPIEIKDAFKDVDLILHSGNIHVPRVLDWLETIAPVKAAGSIDGDRFENPESFSMECQDDPRVSPIQILEIEGHHIGVINNLLVHGIDDELRPGIIERQLKNRPELDFPKMIETIFDASIDIVVFGRMNYAMIEEHQGLLFINAGSPVLPRNLRKLGNVGILDIAPGERKASIIELSQFTK